MSLSAFPRSSSLPARSLAQPRAGATSRRAKVQQELLESEQMAVGIIFNALDAFIQVDQAGVVIE
jgi:hypothetical protein